MESSIRYDVFNFSKTGIRIDNRLQGVECLTV